MLKIIYGHEDRLLPWASEKLGDGEFRRDAYCIGLEKDGELCSVLVYEAFTKFNVNVHIATNKSKVWTRKFARETCAYPFIHLGLNRVTAHVEQKNIESIELCKKAGFKREGLMRNASKCGDIIIFGMTKNECRWIKNG